MPTRLDFFLLPTILAFGSWYLSRNALLRFDFFDMSAFMDAGYRVYRGHAIYSDFFYLAGPIHPYLHALFFKIFGFTKTAIQFHLCVVSGIVACLTYLFARLRLNPWVSALCALVSTFCFYGPVSHPWYDQNAWLWIVVGMVLLFSRGVAWSQREAKTAGFFIGFLVALSFLTKSNIGVLGGMVMLAGMWVSRHRLSSYAGSALGFLTGGAAIVFTLKDPGEYLYQNFLGYFPTGRLTNPFLLDLVLRDTPLLLIPSVGVGICVLAGMDFTRKNQRILVFLFSLSVASILSVLSSSTQYPSNIPMLGFSLALLGFLVSELPAGDGGSVQRVVRNVVLAAACLSFAHHLWYSALAARGIYTWNWRPSSRLAPDYALQSEPFRGWKCNRRYGEGIDRAVDYINQNIPKEDSLVILPDVGVIYGLTGRDCAPDIPFIFTLYEIPPPGKIMDRFRARMLNSSPRWILLHEQFEAKELIDLPKLLKWMQLDEFISKNYREVWRFGDFSIRKFTTAR